MRAGDLNRNVRVERRKTITDSFGQPVDQWVLVSKIWAGIANETGIGAIRSAGAENVPPSIARYSFLVRYDTAKKLGINAGMRISHDGMIFDIKGVIRDLKDRDRAYLVCEQGGSNG